MEQHMSSPPTSQSNPLSNETVQALLSILDQVQISAGAPDLEEKARILGQARRELTAIIASA